MVPISLEEFLASYQKNNKDEDIKQTRSNIISAVESKKNGATCMQCDEPIWAIGSGITGVYMCFTCATGEADDSEDYEIDTVCI